MVVLAVTWMAKVGHEAEVAALFEKLTEQSRKEPGCAMYQVHRHKTEPRRYFIYEQYKDDAALEALAHFNNYFSDHEKLLPDPHCGIRNWLEDNIWKGIMSEARHTLAALEHE